MGGEIIPRELDEHDAQELPGELMIYIVNTKNMPHSIRKKFSRIEEMLKRNGVQANRISPGSFSMSDNLPLTNENIIIEKLGLEKIYEWAMPHTKAPHLDAFFSSIGRNICNLLLYHKCDNCPAKYHKQNREKCVRVLGIFALHKFKEDKHDDS